MATRAGSPHSGRAWTLALATLLLATGALAVLLTNPRLLMVALVLGVVAVVTERVFVRVRAERTAVRGAPTAVANAGLMLSAVVVTPLIAFAVLWFCLMAVLGGAWLLRALGLM